VSRWTPTVYCDLVPSTTCGWCGRFANMTYGDTAKLVDMGALYGGPERYEVMATFECNYCHRLLIAQTASPSRDVQHPFDFGNVTWIPSKGDQPPDLPDVPEHIAAAAQEAYRCRSIGAQRAAVLLARAVIEATSSVSTLRMALTRYGILATTWRTEISFSQSSQRSRSSC
jgi:hypothetical protein